MRTTMAVFLTILVAMSGSWRAQEPAGAVALRNLRVVDGTGSTPAANQTIVISGGKITAVGDNARVTTPSGAREIDLTGHTGLPGLVMMHELLIFMVDDKFSHALPISAPRLYLAFGVTTIRAAGTS